MDGGPLSVVTAGVDSLAEASFFLDEVQVITSPSESAALCVVSPIRGAKEASV